jgi:O-antigen/teichoic acid export membrane protein
MPPEREKYGRDVLVAGLATAVKSLSHLVLLPVATFGLSQPQYGVWTILIVGMSLATPVLSLQLPAALIRFLAGEDRRRHLQNGFYSVLLFLALLNGGVYLLAWLGLPLWKTWPAVARFTPYILPVLLVVALSVLLNAALAYLRAFRLMLPHSLVSILQYITETLAIYLALSYGDGIGDALWGMAAVRGLSTGLALAFIISRIGVGLPRFGPLSPYLRYSLPLVPNSTFYYLFNESDRFIIGRLISLPAVALYHAAYTTAGVIGTFFAPLHFVLFPLLAKLWHNKQKEEIATTMTESLRYGALLAFPALAGMTILARPLLAALTPEAYQESAIYIAPLAAGFALFGFAVIAGNLVATAGQTRYLLAIDASLALGNIALNLLLVPYWGIGGAVLATLAGHLVYAWAVFRRSRRIVPYAIPWRSLAHYTGAAFLMAAALHLGGAAGWPLPLGVGAGVVLYFVLLLSSGGVNRREWRYLKRLVRRP